MVPYSVLIIFLLLQQSHESTTNYIFPEGYSQYFDFLSPEVNIELTESFFSGEENQISLGISLWVKIIQSEMSGSIFIIERSRDEDFGSEILSELFYEYFGPSGGQKSYSLKVKWFSTNYEDVQVPTLPFDSSIDWLFIGISANYENNQVIFYMNNQGTVSSTSSYIDNLKKLTFGSIVNLGSPSSFNGRIGDFKIHNNVVFQLSDWNSEYLKTNICSSGCSSTTICYSEHYQWCFSQPEWFVPLIQPSLWSSRSYLQISNNVFTSPSTHSRYFNKIIPSSTSDDFSISGWFQFLSCSTTATTFLQFSADNNFSVIFQLDLVNSGVCDVLKASIYDTTASNFVSTSSPSLSFIGNWVFFAVTVDDNSLLKLYAKISGAVSLLSSTPVTSIISLLSSSWFNIYIGGGYNLQPYPGSYADIRLYYGSLIDSSILSSTSNLFTPSTYLDPFCISWSSIWVCDTCQNGYFIMNGICIKCHNSCKTCVNGNTELDCISCNNGYYAQPGISSMCFDYCPIGYIYDSISNQCSGSQGEILYLNFEDNLAGNYKKSNFDINYGLYDNYYPNFDVSDPVPANNRGILIQSGGIEISLSDPTQSGRFVSAEFTVEIWAMMISYGIIYQVNDMITLEPSSLTQLGYLSFNIDNFGGIYVYVITGDGSVNYVGTNLQTTLTTPYEWTLYSFSLKFDAASKTTDITFVKNTFSEVKTISNYYKELPEATHWLGSNGGSASMYGFMYSFSLYNYRKTSSQIQSMLGTCTSCACPKTLNHCLPTCTKNQYVDNNENCQNCLSSCKWVCSRPDTCNLCYDDICYKCDKYENGGCKECVDNAVLENGQCKCENGYIKQGSACINSCGDGYYLDLDAKECKKCVENCKKCQKNDSCEVCESEFVLSDQKLCGCKDGYYSDLLGNCLKCDSSCQTCSILSSNCTSCPLSSILYNKNQCLSCSSFEGYSNDFTIPITSIDTTALHELSINCQEICGDGRNMGSVACDDGNTIDNDGCSWNCTVEQDWSCSGGTINTFDICQDLVPPKPLLSYLSSQSEGFLLALSFSEQVNIAVKMSENIKIDIENIRKFSWTITNDDIYYIIYLNIYENAPAGTLVTITFIDPSAITDKNGNKMKESIVKAYLINSYEYQLGNTMTTTITAAAMVSVGTSASAFSFGAFNLQALWGLVEMMQIQNYLIFLSPKYPDNLVAYLSALGIANGNFLPNPFQIFIVKNDPFSDPPDRFLDENFNTDFLMNAGQFVLFWIIILAGLPLSLFFYKYWYKYAIFRWLKNKYFYSILLRAGIESFLEITLSVFLQWRGLGYPDQGIGYLSAALSFLTFIYLMLTYALVIWQVTLKSAKELKTERHEKKFGTLYEDFKKNSKITVSFLLFQNTRRVLFVVLCVFFYEYTIMQAAFSAILSFGYTFSLIFLRPFEKNILGNALNIASEVLFFCSHCIILKFLDDQLSDDDRTSLGWAVIALLSLSLLLHLFANLIIQIIGIYKGFKTLKDLFIKNFSNNFLKRSLRKRRMLDSAISNKKLGERHNVYKTEETEENLAYFEGKETVFEVGECFSFRKTKIDDSILNETLEDETFKQSKISKDLSETIESPNISLKPEISENLQKV